MLSHIPITGNFMPPKSDLVYPSLDDFVDESVSESVVEKSTVETNEPKTSESEKNRVNTCSTKLMNILGSWGAGYKNVLIKIAYSTTRRHFNKITVANNSNFTKKVNNVKGTRVNTARPKAVISVVKGNKGNDVKDSACWVWRPKHKVLDHVVGPDKLNGSLQPIKDDSQDV
ncbi:hypothetical protein Tco_0764431 [Tanacetum coccineum]